jgi:hypothetical protein
MARPKLPNSLKKEKLNLTVSRETKEMIEFIRIQKNISISAFLEEIVAKEYKKLQKSGKAPEVQLHGQMNFNDLPKIDPSKDRAKLEKQLEGLKALLNTDISEKDRMIYEDSVREIRKTLAHMNNK